MSQCINILLKNYNKIIRQFYYSIKMEEDFYEKVVQNTEKNAKVIENFETWVEEIIKLNSKKLIGEKSRKKKNSVKRRT